MVPCKGAIDKMDRTAPAGGGPAGETHGRDAGLQVPGGQDRSADGAQRAGPARGEGRGGGVTASILDHADALNALLMLLDARELARLSVSTPAPAWVQRACARLRLAGAPRGRALCARADRPTPPANHPDLPVPQTILAPRLAALPRRACGAGMRFRYRGTAARAAIRWPLRGALRAVLCADPPPVPHLSYATALTRVARRPAARVSYVVCSGR